MLKLTAALLATIIIAAGNLHAQTTPEQENTAAEKLPQKTNARPENEREKERFETADVKTMAAQCVKFDTEKGIFLIEFFPESAPETVRNFLNLVSLTAFDATTFSRIVPGFIIQGGSIATRETKTNELVLRARRKIPDEPNLIKHERGIVSMARGDEPNSASSNFFILLSEASHLDGKFAAFGRVYSGMDVVEEINTMPSKDEKPEDPVRIKAAELVPCQAKS